MNKSLFLLLFTSISLFASSNNYSYIIYEHGEYMNTSLDDIMVGFQQKDRGGNYALELTFKERISDNNNIGYYSIKTELKNKIPSKRINAKLNYIYTNYNYDDKKYHYISYYLSKYNFSQNNFVETGGFITYSKEENTNLNIYNIIPSLAFVNNLKSNIFYTNILNLYFGNKLNYDCYEDNCNVTKKENLYFKGIEYTGTLNINNDLIFNINLFFIGKLNYLDKYIVNNNFDTIPLYDELKRTYGFTIYKRINDNFLFFIRNKNLKYNNSTTHKYGIGIIYKY